MLSSRDQMGGECDLIPYDDTGRLGLGFPEGGVLGGLGGVSRAEVCPGLPSTASSFSTVVILGTCSSSVAAGLCRATYQCAI